MQELSNALKILNSDPILQKIISQTTLKQYSKSQNCFVSLVKSIVSQQLSVRAAASIFSRFRKLMRYNISKNQVLQTSHEDLRSVGLSNSKAQYIKNVAVFFEQYKINDRLLNALSDEEAIQLLTQIKGVGIWTTQMMLMFHLNRKDVFPIGDLEIRKQMIKNYKLTLEGKALYAKLTKIADHWKPYRSIACIYLWSYEG